MPAFGRHLLSEWMLDPQFTYLNHGTVGAPPRAVLQAQQAIRDEIEAHPAQYMLRELCGQPGWPAPLAQRMRAAAGEVASFFGARAEDTVFVENITGGANAVLRSLIFAPGDEIVVTDRGYGAITNAARFAARRGGATVRVVDLPYPCESAGQLADTIVGALTPRTRLLIVDHITSESALLLPIADIVRRAHTLGVAVLVDGAHAPGSIRLDIPSIGADWYTGNLHKWCMSPRSAGILWADPTRQDDLHPASVSWGLDQGLEREFDWVGTRDPSPYLAAPAGIAFLRAHGGDAVFAANHALAWAAGRHLAQRWDTQLGVTEDLVGSMITVPLPERAGSTMDDALRLRAALYYQDRIEIQMHAWRERLWVRVSAQMYNDLDDVERLAGCVLARIG